MVEAIIFAIAGGGGSGGGGGGGGGGGSGGSGGSPFGYYGVAIFLLVAYVAQTVRKKESRQAGVAAGVAVGFVLTFLSFKTIGIGFGIAALVGSGLGLLPSSSNAELFTAAIAKRNKRLLKKAAERDKAWQEAPIIDRVREVFGKYQADWTKFDLTSIKQYTTEHYFRHATLMLRALDELGRQNDVRQPGISKVAVVDVHDEKRNDDDNFTAYVRAHATDVLIDRRTSQQLYNNRLVFEEFYHFQRHGDEWLLDGIGQETADPKQASTQLRTFAEANDMFYSLDMGTLFLPAKGALFSKATFKNSDVNNHVIGEWDDLLAQLYTYMPDKHSANHNYLIAQINLPKSYDGIVVRRRDTEGWFDRAPAGFQKLKTEWPDFNKRYSLYATGIDRVTSFELLNPGFMAWLYDRDLPVNIEVADNVVYLYARLAKTTDSYDEMLEILRRAHKELKR